MGTPTIIEPGISFSSVYSQLGYNRPVIFRIDYSLTSTHAIVCKYLQSYVGVGTVYGFMDPNSSSTVYISCPNADQSINNSSFVYVQGSYTSTNWYATVY